MRLQTTSPHFADLDPALAFDGLFVPTSGRRWPALSLPERQFGILSVKFKGEQPGAREQSILLALAAQLRIGGDELAAKPEGVIGRALRRSLFAGNDSGVTLISKQVHLQKLLIDAGYGAHSKTMTRHTAEAKEALDVLANLQILVTNKESGWAEPAVHLLSRRFNHKTKELYVAVNPALSHVLLGLSKQFVRVSLLERNLLQGEVAKILHAWLCSHIRLGGTLGNGRGVRIDTLIPHIWGPLSADTSRSVLSKKRGQVRAALVEIKNATRAISGGNGWIVELDGKSGMVNISRPKQLPTGECAEGAVT